MPRKSNPKSPTSKSSNSKTSNSKSSNSHDATGVLDTQLTKTQILNSQQALEKYIQLNQELKQENDRLKAQVRQHDEDHIQVSGFLQSDVEQRTNVINQLQQEIFEQKKKYEEQIRELQSELKRNEKRFESEFSRKDEVIQEQEQTLVQFDRVKRERQILEDVLQAKERESQETKKNYENKITMLQLQFVQEKVNLEKKREELKIKLEKDMNQRAMELLDEKTKQIYAENDQLLKHQEKLQKDFREASQQKEQAIMESSELKRENQLNRDTIKSQAQRGMKLAREVKELKQKLKTVQSTLTAVVNKHLQDRKTMDELHQTELDNLRGENEELKKLLKVRTTELVNLRRVAKRVVSHRSQLEQFFMDALSHVRNEIEDEERHGTDSQTYLPPLSTNRRKLSGWNSSTSMEAATFDQLSWKDKERVLKLLFMKINQQRESTSETFRSTRHETIPSESAENIDDDDDVMLSRLNTPLTVVSSTSLNTPTWSRPGTNTSSRSGSVFITEKEHKFPLKYSS